VRQVNKKLTKCSIGAAYRRGRPSSKGAPVLGQCLGPINKRPVTRIRSFNSITSNRLSSVRSPASLIYIDWISGADELRSVFGMTGQRVEGSWPGALLELSEPLQDRGQQGDSVIRVVIVGREVHFCYGRSAYFSRGGADVRIVRAQKIVCLVMSTGQPPQRKSSFVRLQAAAWLRDAGCEHCLTSGRSSGQNNQRPPHLLNAAKTIFTLAATLVLAVSIVRCSRSQGW